MPNSPDEATGKLMSSSILLQLIHLLAIKNKFVHCLVLLFKAEYPENWPTFFNNDVLSMLQIGGIGGVDGADLGAHIPTQIIMLDFFLRMLQTIDEEVVSTDVPRSNSEAAHNTTIVPYSFSSISFLIFKLIKINRKIT